MLVISFIRIKQHAMFSRKYCQVAMCRLEGLPVMCTDTAHCLFKELAQHPWCTPVPFKISGAIHWTLLPQNVKVRSPLARLLTWLQDHRPVLAQWFRP